MSKKVGVITMHRVLNYGSALQAYAFQRIIQSLGNQCELIDYYYPNKNIINKKDSGIERITKLYYRYWEKIKQQKFDTFYANYFSLSEKSYFNSEDLQQSPPVYDVYVTGSDQVWNVHNLQDDTNFLLSFAPDQAKKIAYAASFACSKLPEEYEAVYKKYLLQYKKITVREESGVQLLKSLANIEASVALDPIFLLTAEEWSKLADTSSFSLPINKPYILVYALHYAYNPYPYLTQLIKKIKKQAQMPVVLLSISNKQLFRLVGSSMKNLHDAVDPLDFLKLFKNAAFVITSSFHGTAFSLNFSRPFYSVLNNNCSCDDSRIHNVLKIVGAEHRAITKDQAVDKFEMDMDYTNIQKKIEAYRKRGKEFLAKNI
jgi:hypothetical protein